MNKNLVISLALVLAVASFIVGEWFVARSYQRNIDLLAPADTTTHVLPPILRPLPPETLKATIPPHHTATPSNLLTIGAVMSNQSDISQAVIDSLQQVVADLSDTVEVTLTDKEGGTHYWRYDPQSKIATELFYPVQIIQPQESFITHNLPAVENPLSKFFVELHPAWQNAVGAGLSIGYDRLAIGRIWMTDQAPITFLTIHFSL